MLPDGTNIQRERQTKAQAKIQALKIKHRNENLRRRLMSLSGEQHNTKQKVDHDITHSRYAELNAKMEAAANACIDNSTIVTDATHRSPLTSTEKIEEISLLDEISAIQKQIIAKSERLTGNHGSNSFEKEEHTKSTESKLLNLKKIIFG